MHRYLHLHTQVVFGDSYWTGSHHRQCQDVIADLHMRAFVFVYHLHKLHLLISKRTESHEGHLIMSAYSD